jgi:hypothetical protein
MDGLVMMPEVVLFDVVNRALDYLRNDYDEQDDKFNSFLMRILNNKILERYNFKDQAIEVFINNNEENPRFLETNLMFNMEREGLPTIHLTLPSEQTQTGGNGIGVGSGLYGRYLD